MQIFNLFIFFFEFNRRLNYFIIIFLIVLAVMTLISFGLSFIYKDVYNKHWYLVGREPKYFTVS